MGFGLNILKSIFKKSGQPTAIQEIKLAPQAVETNGNANRIDRERAGTYHNVLLMLLPIPEIEMTAYDDYYPMMFYGAREMPDGKKFIQAAHDFRQQFRDILDNSSDADFKTDVVSHFTQNVPLLSAMRTMLEMPAKDFEKLSGRPLSMIRDPNETVEQHLNDNSRGGKFLHNKALRELIDLIKAIEEETNYTPALGQTNMVKFLPQNPQP